MMLRKSPAHRMILASLLDGRSPQEVTDFLREHELDDLDAAYLERVRDRIRLRPASWRPRDAGHSACQRFVRERGLEAWFFDDPDMASARLLLRNLRARELAETLAILDAPPAWSRAAIARHRVKITDRGIELYCRFFCDVRDHDDRGVAQFLDRRTAAGWQDRADPRYAALASRRSPVALLTAAMRIGRMPAGLDLTRIVRATRDAAGIATLQAVLADRPRKAERFASVLRSASEVLDVIGDPKAELLQGLGAVTVTSDTGALPMLSDLPGDHSVDLGLAPDEAAGLPGT